MLILDVLVMSKLTKRRDSAGSDASLSSRIPISFTPTLPRKQRSNLSRHQSLVSYFSF